MADDLTTVLRFVGDAASAEASINSLIAKLQQAATLSGNLFSGSAASGKQAATNINTTSAATDKLAASAAKAEAAMFRQAQIQARIQQISGDSAGAVKTLGDALAKATDPKSLPALRAELQKTYLDTNYANSPLIGAIRQINQQTSQLASTAQSVGIQLTALLTVPIVGIGAAAVKSAKDIDAQVNVLKVFTGSAQAAEARLAQLIATAQKTPGLTTGLAATLDAQLRVASVLPATIDKILPAIGRLNAISPLGDPGKFANNLVQLVTQNFEKADLKELVGNSPFAGQLIKQIFNVDSPTNSEAIRASAQALGIKTTEQFFNAFAVAAANNQQLQAVTESIATQFDKLQDRIAVALRPLGQSIISAIAPVVSAIVPVIEKISAAFASLSGPGKAIVLAVAAVAAAIGPLIIALAGAAQAVVVFAEAYAVLSTALAAGGALAALPALLNPVTLAIAGVVAILGVAAIAWATYETAADRAAKLSVEGIKTQQSQIAGLEQLQQQTNALSASQLSSTDRHAQLQAVIAKLDPDTRTYIESIKDEQTQISELNRILREQIGLKQGGISANLGDVGDAAAGLQSKVKELEQSLASLDAESKAYAESGGKSLIIAVDEYGRNVTGAAQSGEEFGKAINKTKGELSGTKDALASFGAEVLALNPKVASNSEEFVAQQRALGRTEDQIRGALAAYDAFKVKQGQVQAASAGTVSAIDQQRAAIDALIQSLDNLNKTANTEVDKRVKEIALSSRTVGEAKKKLADTLRLDDDFFAAVDNKTRVAANLAALNESLNPKTKRTGGGGGARSALSDQRASTNDALGLLKLQEQAAQRLADVEINAARRSFEFRNLTLQQLTDQTIDAERRKLAAQQIVFDAERKEVEDARTKALATKGVKPEQATRIREDASLKIATIAEREAAAIQKSNDAIQAATDSRIKAEEKAEEDHQARLNGIRDIGRKALEASTRAAVAAGQITNEAAEIRVASLEQQRFKEREAALIVELAQKGKNAQEFARINDELVKLDAERAASGEDAARRLIEARRQDVEDARRAFELQRGLNAQVVQGAVNALERRATALESRAQGNSTLGDTARLARQQAAFAEEQRLNDENNAKIAISNQAILDNQKLTDQQKYDAIAANHQLIEQEQQRHNDALAQIQAAVVTPFQAIQGVLKQAASGFFEMGIAALASGQSVGQAMRAMAAAVLKQIASIAAVEAVKNVAYGLNALGYTIFTADPRGALAASHYFGAAALWGSLAVGAALGSAAVGRGGGGAGGGAVSAGGGGSNTSPTRRDDPQTFRQDSINREQKPQIVIIRTEVGEGTVVRHLIQDVNNNGPSRQIIRREAGNE